MAITIREMTDGDRAGVMALDTSFETHSIYEVVTTPRSFELVERPLATPLVKRYPIADAFAHWATWDDGWVALDGTTIVGFAATEYEAWHARLVLWHFYVAPAYRRAGTGRALLAEVEEHGRKLGALRVWLETSNVNVPGIAAYARLGYTLVGGDISMYDDLPYANEKAVFLAKSL